MESHGKIPWDLVNDGHRPWFSLYWDKRKVGMANPNELNRAKVDSSLRSE